MSEGVEAAVVKVHYKQPTRDEWEVAENSVIDDGHEFVSASADFKFAVAVAEFGMFLRTSSVENGWSLSAIGELAQTGLGVDRDGRRAGFIELIRQTQLLTRG
jgi:Ca-activated chloride channel family protein